MWLVARELLRLAIREAFLIDLFVPIKIRILMYRNNRVDKLPEPSVCCNNKKTLRGWWSERRSDVNQVSHETLHLINGSRENRTNHNALEDADYCKHLEAEMKVGLSWTRREMPNVIDSRTSVCCRCHKSLARGFRFNSKHAERRRS